MTVTPVMLALQQLGPVTGQPVPVGQRLNGLGERSVRRRGPAAGRVPQAGLQVAPGVGESKELFAVHEDQQRRAAAGFERLAVPASTAAATWEENVVKIRPERVAVLALAVLLAACLYLTRGQTGRRAHGVAELERLEGECLAEKRAVMVAWRAEEGGEALKRRCAAVDERYERLYKECRRRYGLPEGWRSYDNP